MRTSNWLTLLVGLLACGLIAAGCGDDDESSTPSTPSSEESTIEDSSDESTAEESSSGDSGGVDAEGVYEACADVVAGTAAEDQAIVACEQARDSFESCAEQAEGLDDPAREDAMAICQMAADQTIAALESSGGY